MLVRIRLFAMMAQHAALGQFTLDLPPGATLAQVRPLLLQRYPELPWPAGTLLAVNQQYAVPDQPLHEQDEIAVIPPVSGG